MMKLKTALATAVGACALTLAAFAPAADATTFCVPTYHPACPDNGSNVAQSDVQTAMQAQGSDGIADQVLIAPGTYTDPDSIDPAGTDELLVQGAGPDQTTLTSSSSLNAIVLNLHAPGNARAITVRDLTVAVPDSMPDGGGLAIQQSGDLLENVDIVSHNPQADAITSWVGAGGVYRGGEIRGDGTGSIDWAIATSALTTDITVEDVVIRDAGTALRNTHDVTLTARRMRIVGPKQVAVTASRGTTQIENSVIETAPVTNALYAFANSASDVAIVADHVTAVGSGNATAVGAHVQAGAAGDASVTVTNSILHGYVGAYLRQAPTGVGTGDAAVAISHTNVPLGTVVDSGDGAADLAASNTAHDPGFEGPGDFRLAAGSPSIDAGDPGAGLTSDILGVTRPLDGDGDGNAVRDQGAYEFVPPDDPSDPSDPQDPDDPQDPNDPNDPPNPSDPNDPDDPKADKQAPETIKGKGPKRKITKRTARFTFSSEPGATFRCALDRRPFRACKSPLKLKRLKRGKHTLRVAAVDAAGNVDPTPATWKFKVKRKR